MNLHERIKEERERLGYNQTAFAALAGATKHSQINWEKGTAFPNASVLAAWAGVGLDVAYVVTGQRTPSPSALPPSPPPTPEEQALLSDYRTTDAHGREIIRATASAAARAAHADTPARRRRRRAG